LKKPVMIMLCLCMILGLSACNNNVKDPIKPNSSGSSVISGDTSSEPNGTTSEDSSSVGDSASESGGENDDSFYEPEDDGDDGGWGDYTSEESKSSDVSKGSGSSAVNINKTIAAITSESDKELLRNPNRGFRLETVCNVANNAGEGNFVHPDPAVHLYQFKEFYMAENPQLAQVYFYLTGYRNTAVIPQYGLDRIQQYFDAARDYKMRLLVRFAYQNDMNTGAGEASEAIMLGHMKQLKPILEKNRDVIHAVQSGFLGAWGEWHSNKLTVNKTTLLRGIIDMTPIGKYIHMRLPEYKNLIPKTDPAYKMMGFDNDSLFGEAQGGTGGVDPGTAPWKQITEESPFVPVDGELFWGRWSINQDGNDDGKLIDGFKV